MTHEPACFMSEPFTIDRPGLCICDRLRAAYRRGYNDHARSVQHWQDTHGAYRQPPDDGATFPERYWERSRARLRHNEENP